MAQTMQPLHIPTDFVDQIQGKCHIALFYEDPGYAKLIAFRFLKNGLLKGEDCLYVTSEDTGDIVVKMLDFGIPLQYFHTKQLRVIQIKERTGSKDDIISACKVDIARIMSGIKNSFRIVSRIVPNVNTVNGISAELEMEHFTNSIFDNLSGSIMCPYDISGIEPSKRKHWLDNLRETHHAIIYVSKSGHSGVFTLDQRTF